MLSYAKPFNNNKQLVKIWNKKEEHVSNFSTLSIDDM